MPDDPTPVDVSVLVLAYNHEPYVEECLESILGQRFDGSLEVLVGEDHSPDGTLAVVRAVADRDPRVRIITSEQNVGMHANNRRLLRAARGTYVAYCEGDDLWQEPTKLQQQIRHLEANPALTGVHSDVDHLVLTGRGWVRRPHVWTSIAPDRGAQTSLADLLRRNLVQTCSVVVRREFIADYPDSALAAATYAVEDWPMFLHVAAQGPLGVIDRSLATYRRVEGSATNAGADANHRRIADQLRMLSHAEDLYPGHDAEVHDGLTRTVDALVLNAVVTGRPDLLQTSLEEARRHADALTAIVRLGSIARDVPGALPAATWLSNRVLALRQRLAYRQPQSMPPRSAA